VEWYGMVWYGAPPTPWTAIAATRWWQLDRAPAEHAQTVSVPSALVRRWVSFPQGQAPAVAELRACAISLCLEHTVEWALTESLQTIVSLCGNFHRPHKQTHPRTSAD
jgi:hypothetical protein